MKISVASNEVQWNNAMSKFIPVDSQGKNLKIGDRVVYARPLKWEYRGSKMKKGVKAIGWTARNFHLVKTKITNIHHKTHRVQMVKYSTMTPYKRLIKL